MECRYLLQFYNLVLIVIISIFFHHRLLEAKFSCEKNGVPVYVLILWDINLSVYDPSLKEYRIRQTLSVVSFIRHCHAQTFVALATIPSPEGLCMSPILPFTDEYQRFLDVLYNIILIPKAPNPPVVNTKRTDIFRVLVSAGLGTGPRTMPQIEWEYQKKGIYSQSTKAHWDNDYTSSKIIMVVTNTPLVSNIPKDICQYDFFPAGYGIHSGIDVAAMQFRDHRFRVIMVVPLEKVRIYKNFLHHLNFIGIALGVEYRKGRSMYGQNEDVSENDLSLDDTTYELLETLIKSGSYSLERYATLWTWMIVALVCIATIVISIALTVYFLEKAVPGSRSKDENVDTTDNLYTTPVSTTLQPNS